MIMKSTSISGPCWLFFKHGPDSRRYRRRLQNCLLRVRLWLHVCVSSLAFMWFHFRFLSSISYVSDMDSYSLWRSCNFPSLPWDFLYPLAFIWFHLTYRVDAVSLGYCFIIVSSDYGFDEPFAYGNCLVSFSPWIWCGFLWFVAFHLYDFLQPKAVWYVLLQPVVYIRFPLMYGSYVV